MIPLTVFSALRWRTFAIVCIAVLQVLQGCANIPRNIESADPRSAWQLRQKQIQDIDQWQLKGRISIASKEDSGSVRLFWTQDKDRYTLRLVAPLGQGTLLIKGSAEEVIMRNSEGEEFKAANAEALIWQQTGWFIPVSGLRYWILGLPAAAVAIEDYGLDSAGRLTALKASDWEINFQRYRAVEKHMLPDKIRLQNSRLRIKLAITDWQLQ